MKKRSSHFALIYTPGRWTGNNIFLRVTQGAEAFPGPRGVSSAHAITELTCVQIAAKKGRPSTSQVITGKPPVTYTTGPSESDHSGT